MKGKNDGLPLNVGVKLFYTDNVLPLDSKYQGSGKHGLLKNSTLKV